nr:MAG TPA: hypothetical protein [Caudoviricetes sp.]
MMGFETLRYRERGVGRYSDRHARTVLRYIDRSLVDVQVRIAGSLLQRNGSGLGALGGRRDLLGTLRDSGVGGGFERQRECELLRCAGVAGNSRSRRSGSAVGLIRNCCDVFRDNGAGSLRERDGIGIGHTVQHYRSTLLGHSGFGAVIERDELGSSLKDCSELLVGGNTGSGDCEVVRLVQTVAQISGFRLERELGVTRPRTGGTDNVAFCYISHSFFFLRWKLFYSKICIRKYHVLALFQGVLTYIDNQFLNVEIWQGTSIIQHFAIVDNTLNSRCGLSFSKRPNNLTVE